MTQRTTAREVQLFSSMPLLFLLTAWMWGSSKLGLSWPVLRALQRAMQSKKNKESAFRGYEPGAQDLFVCTYSKSGTNWALQIGHQIAHRGAGAFEHIHHVVSWPEAPMPDIVPLSDASTWQNAPTGLRVIKTHLEMPYVPYSPKAKYVIIVRDPKDVFVSSYHFSKGMVAQGCMVPVEEWLDAFLSDEFLYGSWAEHVAGFWPWRDRKNVLFLTFAQMKAEPEETVQRMAELMGVALTPEELADVVAQSSFSHMKAMDHKFAPRKPYPFNHLLPGVMLRKGETGVSPELLTPAQQQQIDAYVQSQLERLGSDFPYEAMISNRAPQAALSL